MASQSHPLRAPSLGDIPPAEVAAQALACLAAGVLVVHGEDVAYANPRACELLGDAARTGQPVAALGLPKPEGTGDEPSRFELEHVDASGRVVQLGFTVTCCGAGNRDRWLYLFQDISPVAGIRRERDRLLQIAAINAVLPSMLHELRNPITAVTTTVEVMLDEAPASVHDDLHAILSVLRQLLLTLHGVGAVGRELASTRPAAVDLAIEETVRVLEGKARTRGVTLSAEVPALPLLPLDPSVLRAIVANLIDNALLASRPGDRVDVRAGWHDGVFELHVHDTGRGMSPEVLARATELFFSTKTLGSGIGLSLCARAVEGAGGTLAIESAPDRGTRVDIAIPLLDRGQARPMQPTL